MPEKVKIVLIKPWRLHAQDAELELDKPIADLLVENRRARLADVPIPDTILSEIESTEPKSRRSRRAEAV